jgi:ATP-dependent Clp protease protease subunit
VSLYRVCHPTQVCAGHICHGQIPGTHRRLAATLEDMSETTAPNALPKADISLYINSPGGSVSAGLAIYDTMNFISNDVATYAMGLVASMGQVLLACGSPGKRYSLPHARIMMHQPSGGMGGTATDIRIQAEQSILAKKDLAKLISQRTGQPLERIEADFDRDRWFTPEQAKEYGIVDDVLTRPVPVIA